MQSIIARCFESQPKHLTYLNRFSDGKNIKIKRFLSFDWFCIISSFGYKLCMFIIVLIHSGNHLIANPWVIYIMAQDGGIVDQLKSLKDNDGEWGLTNWERFIYLNRAWTSVNYWTAQTRHKTAKLTIEYRMFQLKRLN